MTAIPAAPAVVGMRRAFWRRTRDARTAWLYLIPALLVMAIITVYPLLFQTYMSFTDFGLRNPRPHAPSPPFVGLNNYINILASNLAIPNFNFLRLILFNLWWAFSNVVVHVILGVLIAVLLNTPGLWFKRFYRAMFILPVVIPAIIVATV